ncbi:hypothetical protein [Jatrophihabitans sp.]|jgi:hypothetical protein|uniref:hypothetical protein n=1 Tax=Jatrophihabitans sp. TaxID=1932789 RepID=UPI002EF2BCF8
MTTPHGDEFEHRDDLEHRLTELFQQRAATVTRARPVDFGSDSGAGTRKAPPGVKQVRLGTHRQNLGVLAAAAAVFVAIAATILGIQSNRHQPAPPLSTGSHPVSTGSHPLSTPTASPTGPLDEKACQAPSSWRRAIAGGTVPVDRRLNTVVSANGETGDYLVVQGNEPPAGTSSIYSDVELALFHGATGRTLYTPARSSDIPVADPTGAITADWIAFSVSHPQSLGYTYTVMLYDRSTGRITTLAEASEEQYLHGEAFSGAPVIAAGKVYWLAGTFNKPATTTLHSWDLARGGSAGSVPAANATALISYGSGLAISYGGGHPDGALFEPTVIRNGAGRPLTKTQLTAMSHGTNFGYDGASKLSWLRHENGSVGYEDLLVGGDGTNSEGLVRQSPGIAPAIHPFVQVVLDDADPAAGQNALVDLRTSRAVALPAGVELQAVVGASVVFGTGATKSDAAGLSMVALSTLPPVSC